jgi:hypothetical protein
LVVLRLPLVEVIMVQEMQVQVVVQGMVQDMEGMVQDMEGMVQDMEGMVVGMVYVELGII